jgi:hypothetical protein
MALKPGGRVCRIREQVIDDLASGLVLNFATRGAGAALTVGGIPALGRAIVFIFDAGGAHSATVNVLLDDVMPDWAKDYNRDSS